MQADLTLHATFLARGQMQRLEHAKGKRVLNLQGTLWLTQQGEWRDTVLEPGEIARVDRDGLTILSALRDARFVLLHEHEAVPDGAWHARHAQATLALN